MAGRMSCALVCFVVMLSLGVSACHHCKQHINKLSSMVAFSGRALLFTLLLLMLLLPVSVYIIALSGALHSSGNMVMPALISIGMLISAEFAWRLVVWRTPALKQVT